MNLYILRHGIAVEPGTAAYAKDADRPLTPKGERKLGQIAEALEDLGISFDLILSSPFLRARQTAELVAEALKNRKQLSLSDELTPHGNPKKLIEFIQHVQPAPNNVLLVGHEPYLSEFISWLLVGNSTLSVIMKKGGLCKLSAESLKPGRCATLEWLLTPKLMATMI
jgi:phosphohistidine phosphatase